MPRASSASFGDARVDLFTVPAGEANKTREQWTRLTDELLAAGFGRDGAIVALGGGMTGDLAGFVAATYMRGVPFVQVPTTLLAMIDASIGGKTGVDTNAGKNLVGAFHDPSVVIADPETLETLPLRELASGSAEAIKHGVIADAAYFAKTVEESPARVRGPGRRRDASPDLRKHPHQGGVVVAARREEHGLRKTLNFGHTIGHADRGGDRLRDAARRGRRDRHAAWRRASPSISALPRPERARRSPCASRSIFSSEPDHAGAIMLRAEFTNTMKLLPILHVDKKSRAGVVEFALPKRIGMMARHGKEWTIPVSDDAIREMFPNA